MAELKFEPVPHDHDSFLAKARARNPGGHPKCPTYGHPNCSTLVAVI